MFRQRSGSSLCYACGKLNRVDAPKCFYCGRRNPGLWGFGAMIGRLLGGLDFAALVTVVAVAASTWRLVGPSNRDDVSPCWATGRRSSGHDAVAPRGDRRSTGRPRG